MVPCFLPFPTCLSFSRPHSLSLFVPVGGAEGWQDGGCAWASLPSLCSSLSLSLFVPVGEGRLGRRMASCGCSWSPVTFLLFPPPSLSPSLVPPLSLFSCLSAKADWAEGWRRVVVHAWGRLRAREAAESVSPRPTCTEIPNNYSHSEPIRVSFQRSELCSLFVGVGSNPTDLKTLLRDFGRVV